MPWCAECACITNHTTRQHLDAEWERDHPDADDDRFDVKHDQYLDGKDL